MGGLIQRWVQDLARGRSVKEESIFQSEYPTNATSGVASGFRIPTSESCSILLSIPANKWFRPRMLWVDNMNTQMNRIALYVLGSGASASATIGGLWIGPRETEFIAMDGLNVGGDIYVSCLVASCAVRVAGVLIDSTS